jgi:hypothetical protein
MTKETAERREEAHRESTGMRSSADVAGRYLGVSVTTPFDLRLSLEAAASFFPATGPPPAVLRTALHLDGVSALIEISQPRKEPGVLMASSRALLAQDQLREVVRWLTSAELDLRPFYALVALHPVMWEVVRASPGLKPLRPPTLFEMAVVAVTEQQLSLAAAFHIRSRLVRQFGEPLGELWVFPSPERLAAASLSELGRCGLSLRKAQYISELGRRFADRGSEFRDPPRANRRADKRRVDELSRLRQVVSRVHPGTRLRPTRQSAVYRYWLAPRRWTLLRRRQSADGTRT